MFYQVQTIHFDPIDEHIPAETILAYLSGEEIIRLIWIMDLRATSNIIRSPALVSYFIDYFIEVYLSLAWNSKIA